MDGFERLLTVDEVAAMLQMSPQWVRQHAGGFRKPGIPHVKLGKVLRFRRSDIEAMIERQTRDSHTGTP